MYVLLYLFCVYCNAYHRYLHVLTHSFPTRRSPDLGHDASHSNAGGQVAVAFGLELGNQGSGGNVGWFPAEGPSRTLDTNTPPGVATAMAVRRLTPRECERLQGFPDAYTLVPYRGKPAADGPRYKEIGREHV